MTMLAKITLYTKILVHLVLICRGGDQSDFEHVVTEEYWNEVEEQDNQGNEETICWFNDRILRVGEKLSNNCVCRKSGYIVCP